MQAKICLKNEPIEFGRKLSKAEISAIISLNPQNNISQHEEAKFLQPYIEGLALDVGCGFEKTHPGCLGIDMLANGEWGQHGCMIGNKACTDIQCEGDYLYFIEDSTFDTVTSRHSIEHFWDPHKALVEWFRVLRTGGTLGIVAPNDHLKDFFNMDKDHKCRMFPEVIFRMLESISSCGTVQFIPTVQQNWSFGVICKKI